MSNYQGLFVRHSLGETPDSRKPAWSLSPDIILAGKQAPDSKQVQEYASEAGYQKDYNTGDFADIYTGQYNYVYLRALNTTSDQAKARVWFFHTTDNLCMQPGNWSSKDISILGVSMNYTSISADAKQKCVTYDPFVWTPGQLDSGRHYCVISWIEDAPLTIPPRSPIKGISKFANFDALVKFVIDHPNMGWRNTHAITSNTPTQQYILPIAGPDKGGQMSIGVVCSDDFPEGAEIEYHVPDLMKKSVIFQTDSGKTDSRTVNIPDKFVGEMSVSYWKKNTNPPKTAWFTSSLAMPISVASEHTNDMVLKKARHLIINLYNSEFKAVYSHIYTGAFHCTFNK